MNKFSLQPEDLVLYALCALPPEEMREMHDALGNDVEARSELARITGDLALLALSTGPEQPPSTARDRLLMRLSHEPRSAKRAEVRAAVPAFTENDSLPSLTVMASAPKRLTFRLATVVPWLGWAIAALLIVTTSRLSYERNALRDKVAQVEESLAASNQQTALARRVLNVLQNPAAKRVTLTVTTHAAVPQGRATYDQAKGALVFFANNLKPLAPGRTYELWVIPADGHAPIPAGTFRPNLQGDASVLLPRLPSGVEAKAFGITIEQEGGAATPTLPIIMAGAQG